MKKIYLILGIIILGAFILVLVSFIKGTKEIPVPTPRPISSSLEKDYSYLNRIVPGKSTIADTIKVNGNPASTKPQDSKTYLYFQTPIRNILNTVAFKNGVEIYALENVFGNYRGMYDNFTGSYGEPSLTLYSNASSLSWYIFLQNGLGVETNGKDISQILYFTPESESSFLDGIAKEIGLSKATPRPDVTH